MTREEYNKCNGFEQRLAVAVLCNWRDFHPPMSDDEKIFSGAYGTTLFGINESNPKNVAVPDYLNDLNACHELKTPNLTLGQKVVPGDNWDRDFPWYLKRYALYLIRQARRLISNSSKGKLNDHSKKQIRDCLQVFREATEFEVAGLTIQHGYNLDSTMFNACYLAGVLGAASPPHYGVQLVVRFERDGKRLALITGDISISDSSLKPRDET